MKSASIILSIILLVLSGLPCADADKDVVIDATGKVIAHTDEHSKELHTDLCSPFCVCNCCGVQILSFTPALVFEVLSVPADYAEKPLIIYNSNLASQFLGGIWQPPQLS